MYEGSTVGLEIRLFERTDRNEETLVTIGSVSEVKYSLERLDTFEEVIAATVVSPVPTTNPFVLRLTDLETLVNIAERTTFRLNLKWTYGSDTLGAQAVGRDYYEFDLNPLPAGVEAL